jgi:hypothetical protein
MSTVRNNAALSILITTVGKSEKREAAINVMAMASRSATLSLTK